MATTLTDIETLVRTLLGDFSHNMVPGDIFTYANSSVFTLTESNVIAVTEVLKNDTPLTSGQYSFDSSTNKVTVSASLVSGDTVEVQYSYYPNYSATEINSYTNAALVYLSINNFYDFIVSGTSISPDPSQQEINLIALVSATLIEPDNKSYRLPDLSISVPRDLPLHEKITRIISVAKRQIHGAFDLYDTGYTADL